MVGAQVRDLSILIAARNEQFLARTVADVLAHKRGDTDIIVVLDGSHAHEALPVHPDVTLITHSTSIGQRAAINEGARLSDAHYLMKLDAHCAVDEAFDVKMLAHTQADWTCVPTMRNLHVFDWLCANGHRRYQGLSGPCIECGLPVTQDIVWIAKRSPQSNSYAFDATPHFQYFREYNKRPEGIGKLTESMSLQGSCFMLSRERYFALGVCDEAFGSWGSQGIEVACKTWLSGGRVMVNHHTWYAHLFRTQGGDFGFPYPLSGNAVDHAKQRARELFFEGCWPQAVYPLAWLVKHFWPVPGWTSEDLCKLEASSPTPA